MKVAKLGLAAALVLGAVLLTASPAVAEGVFYYRGPHAVPSEFGGFCHISVRHFHTYKPEDAKVFRYDDNTYIFIGDPTAHGYSGPRIPFYGHHTIPLGWGGGWCFIAGPHYHWYRPVGIHYNYLGGVYYYVGPYTDPWYIRNRRIYEPVFSTYYVTRPGYVRPVIYTPPPRVYAGPRVVVPVQRWSGPTVRVGVGAPGVRVGVGAPGVRVGVGAPGVRVGVGAPGVGVGIGVRPGMPAPGGPGVRPGMPAPGGPGVRPGMPAPGGPGVRSGMPAPGARPGMPAPGARPGMPAPGARPGAPTPMAGKGPPGVRPPPPVKGPIAGPRPAPMGKVQPPAAKGPAPTPRPAMTPAPKAPQKVAPAPKPLPKPATPIAPRPGPKKR